MASNLEKAEEDYLDLVTLRSVVGVGLYLLASVVVLFSSSWPIRIFLRYVIVSDTFRLFLSYSVIKIYLLLCVYITMCVCVCVFRWNDENGYYCVCDDVATEHDPVRFIRHLFSYRTFMNVLLY